ncbi:MAG: hypothetical protein B9S32_09360 [Verrucomicrobia bacterium Tous-C9LFEB]|nr:MAG: hypothetical protein B9S32_09360 [Verrucomicrobia bacterium Tous-C9LFEB]
MTLEEALRDVETRENQLRLHIIRSEEYVRRFERDFKRQVFMLYLAIVLLLLFQSLFAISIAGHLKFGEMALVLTTSFLAIMNCVLLINTKSWLKRINESWIEPQEKTALDMIRMQRREIMEKIVTSPVIPQDT